jgi:hypothetical protein
VLINDSGVLHCYEAVCHCVFDSVHICGRDGMSISDYDSRQDIYENSDTYQFM